MRMGTVVGALKYGMVALVMKIPDQDGTLWIVSQVNAQTTDHCVSNILLHGRMRPSSKGFEIGERWVSII